MSKQYGIISILCWIMLLNFQKQLTNCMSIMKSFWSFWWSHCRVVLIKDWKNTNIFVKCLHSYYTTINFSSSFYVTFNSNTHELHVIRIVLTNEMDEEDETLKKWVESMKAKFDKYCTDVGKMNKLWFITMMFDSKYKLNYLKLIFKCLYLSHIIEWIVNRIKVTFDKLLKLMITVNEEKWWIIFTWYSIITICNNRKILKRKRMHQPWMLVICYIYNNCRMIVIWKQSMR